MNDIKRAEYIVKATQLHLYNQAPSDIIDDMEFLEEQITKRFVIHTSDQDQVQLISKEIKDKQLQTEDELKKCLDSFDWDGAKSTLAKYSFLIKLEEEAKYRLEEF